MQHHDFQRRNGTKKNCPSLIRSSDIAPDWNSFLTLIGNHLSGVLNSEGFAEGFSAPKESLSIIKESLISSDINSDSDHGDIKIPVDLLSTPL